MPAKNAINVSSAWRDLVSCTYFVPFCAHAKILSTGGKCLIRNGGDDETRTRDLCRDSDIKRCRRTSFDTTWYQMSLLIVPLLYPIFGRVMNSSDPGDALCSDGILVSKLISGMSDFDGLFRKIVANLQKASEQLIHQLFPITSSALRYCSGTFRGSNNGTRSTSAVRHRDRAASTVGTAQPNRFARVQ